MCSRGDERAKSHAASSRKGVVGNTGRNMPIVARARLINAMNMSRCLMRIS